MTPQEVLIPLLPQVDILREVVNESPYLSKEKRKEVEAEIAALSTKLKEGALSLQEGEKWLTELDQKIAANEISSLASKINYLNPSSPRLKSLSELGRQLKEGVLTPDQIRQAIQDLMNG